MKKIKTKWNLALLYKSEKDPKIEYDMKQIESAILRFEKKYKNRRHYMENEHKLFEALKDYEALEEKTVARPALYFHYLKDIDGDNKYAKSQLNLFSSRLAKIGNKLVFFTLNLGKIPKPHQNRFLKSKKLSHYAHFLKLVFDNAKYDLSDKEEKIMNLKSQASYEMWVSGQSKLLNTQTVNFGSKDIAINEALEMIPNLTRPKRIKLSEIVQSKLKEISYFAENELNAIITDKKINDELRGFKNPWSGMILSNENDEESILKLAKLVTKNFNISRKFYALKAKLMSLKKLHRADLSAPIGKVKRKYNFNEAVTIIGNALRQFDPKYADIFQSFLERGQIDVYPMKSKEGGGYCSSARETPTFILLNYGKNLRSITTIAHEMGHAIHAHLSKSQSPLYADCTISVAEVASTLFENFIFDELIKNMSKRERVIALHDKISDSVGSIFRQIAAFNFEMELHNSIRKRGYLESDEIASLLNKHMAPSFGPIVDIKEKNGYAFVYWSHFRRFFYVYTYAFGALISSALHQSYKKDKTFIKKIEQFMMAGSSKSPYQIFKDAGIDINDMKFFETGLEGIDKDISRLEREAREAGMI